MIAENSECTFARQPNNGMEQQLKSIIIAMKNLTTINSCSILYDIINKIKAFDTMEIQSKD